MCKVCGCTPCKCGRLIINRVCEGCGKPYDLCTCEPKKQFITWIETATLKY